MSQARIENPILNSPYEEPEYHYRFTDEGITDEVVDGRRVSSYLRPVPQVRGRNKAQRESYWFEEKPEENRYVNLLRRQIAVWRKGGYLYASAVTRRLLEYWRDPSRENKLFFCQIEAGRYRRLSDRSRAEDQRRHRGARQPQTREGPV